jgi:16S rRNA G966 N2-methylase RsmD
MVSAVAANALWYGDNLEILDRIGTESVDLIYLDPPFNSNRAYNVIYSGGGEEDRAQIEAFDDRK